MPPTLSLMYHTLSESDKELKLKNTVSLWANDDCPASTNDGVCMGDGDKINNRWAWGDWRRVPARVWSLWVEEDYTTQTLEDITVLAPV